MSHTPGPWNLETVPTSVGICHKIGPFPISHRERPTYACVYDDRMSRTPTPELLANARLIAAAPDLLAVVQAALNWWEKSSDSSEFARKMSVLGIWDTARSALAKVEGRS